MALLCVLVLSLLNAAACQSTNVYYNVTEEQGALYLIGNIADSAELELQSDLRFTLLPNGYPHASKFDLDTVNGDLVTSESLDRETICPFEFDCIIQLAVIAKSELSDDLFSIKIFIDLLDINDNSPDFGKALISFDLVEGTPLNTSFSFDGAVDLDSVTFGITRYEILDDVPFRANHDVLAGRPLLRLIVTGAVDRELVSSYQFQVIAYDGGDPPKIGTVMMNVMVTDVNDNNPKFTQASYNQTIYDDSNIDTMITRVFATDLDEGQNGLVIYRLSSLQSDEIKSTFSINETSGEVFLKQSLITRSKEYYRVIVEASDMAAQPLISKTLVFVRVIDRHNNFPVININLLSSSEHAEISEHASQGATVAHVAVTDTDTGDNGLVTCMLATDVFKLQRFDANEYKVVVFESLDRETTSLYNVNVICQDTGSPPKSSNKTFTVDVIDENDNDPYFLHSSYTVEIFENNQQGKSILKVSAKDLDIGINSEIEYQLQSLDKNEFSINETTGELFVDRVLDREEQFQYNFLVYAIDKGTPAMTGTGSISINVRDKNDNSPIFAKDLYKFSILENSFNEALVGEVRATDIDDKPNGDIVYTVKSSVEIPFVVVQNGSILVTVPLDREKKDKYDFQISASDQGIPPLQASTNISVEIVDENDNIPVFLFPNKHNNSISMSYKTPTNTVVGIIQAFDNDTGVNALLSFYLNDDNATKYFLLNSYSGEIFLIKELSAEDIGSLTFEVIVQDRGNIPLKSVHNITIVITNERSALSSGLDKNFVVAIAISTITIVLAVIIVLTIYLLRRQESINRLRLQESQESASSKMAADGEEAGFIQVNTPVYYPPTYNLNMPVTYTRPPPPSYSPPLTPNVKGHQQLPSIAKFNTIQRSTSVQLFSTVPSQDHCDSPKEIQPQNSAFSLYENGVISGGPPLWEELEVNDIERQRNQLMTIEYQRSLLRLQHYKQCKRSNSVLTI